LLGPGTTSQLGQKWRLAMAHTPRSAWHTHQGCPLTLRRALASGNSRIAEAAARDVEHIALRDALELAAAGFREALHSERGVDALRGCL